ncbi:MAG: hypothetical protein JO102_02025, partial [Elusimicrobia bacterium]|nr:hypothetical protein [Elusimicrobiota bacterium]
LATEWWNWQKKPFVFARWVIRKGVGAAERASLENTLRESLRQGQLGLSTVANAAAEEKDFPQPLVERYLSEFVYKIGPEAEESSRLFRSLLEEAGLLKTGQEAAVRGNK